MPACCLHAAEVLDEVIGGCPLADAVDIEDIARGARAVSATSDPLSLATAHGCTVVVSPDLPRPFDGLLMEDGKIYVRSMRRTRLRVVIFHELAHWLCRRSRWIYSHADVWCLTLALAIPQPVIEVLYRRDHALDAEALAQFAELPTWCGTVRLKMPDVAMILGETSGFRKRASV